MHVQPSQVDELRKGAGRDGLNVVVGQIPATQKHDESRTAAKQPLVGKPKQTPRHRIWAHESSQMDTGGAKGLNGYWVYIFNPNKT